MTPRLRRVYALQLRRSGLSFAEVGKELGVSAARAAQIVTMAERQEDQENQMQTKGYPSGAPAEDAPDDLPLSLIPYELLSVRARNCFLNSYQGAKAVDALTVGDMRKFFQSIGPKEAQKIPNFGVNAADQVGAFMPGWLPPKKERVSYADLVKRLCSPIPEVHGFSGYHVDRAAVEALMRDAARAIVTLQGAVNREKNEQSTNGDCVNHTCE